MDPAIVDSAVAVDSSKGELDTIVANMSKESSKASSPDPSGERKNSSTSTSSEDAEKKKRKYRETRKASLEKRQNPLATLIYRQHDLDSVKCLVASRMVKQFVKCEPGPSLEPHDTKVTHNGKPQQINRGKTSLTLSDGSGKLTDPFAIAWFLAMRDQKASETPDKFGALMMQWHSFAMNEIRPFMTPLIREPQKKMQDKENNQRKHRLMAALTALKTRLKQSRFLAAKKLTFADVDVATELLPLWDKEAFALRGHCVWVKDLLAMDFTLVREWYDRTIKSRMFNNALRVYKKQCDLPMHIQPRTRTDSRVVKKERTTESDSGAKGDGVDGNVAGKKGRTYKVSATAQANNVFDQLDLAGMAEKPFKILCLHGYRQNDVSFREKTGAFRKCVDKYCEFTFICAPHPVLPMGHEDINQDGRGWWFSRDNDYFKANDATDCDKGFDASMELIEKTFEEHGPFDGIMGFSQGAALASLLCLMRERGELKPVVDFKFAIMVASFKSLSTKHAKWYSGEEVKKVTIPTMHVLGSDDKVIRKGVTEQLFSLFGNLTKLYHPGGHYVAARPMQKKGYLKFLDKCHKLRNPEAAIAAGDGAPAVDKTETSKKEATEDSGLEVDESKEESKVVVAKTDENQNKSASEDKTEVKAEVKTEAAAPVNA